MFQLYDNGYIGEDISNTEISWRGGQDSEVLFLETLKSSTHPDTEYYRNKKEKLTYTFNQYGHRCKNIDEIDLNNYILFFGCSHTEGTGNYIEDTFPYIVSQKLSMDYYNLGLRSSGVDVQLHNLFVWVTRNKLPNYLIWQWPPEPRIPVILKNKKIRQLGSWCTDEEEISLLYNAQKLKYCSAKRYMVSSILKNLNIPVIEINVDSNPGVFFYQKIDSARDVFHYGPKSNLKLSNTIVNYITNKYIIT